MSHVLFVCIKNAGRSQMAEAFARIERKQPRAERRALLLPDHAAGFETEGPI